MSLMFLVPFVASGAGGKFDAPSSASRTAYELNNNNGINGDLDLSNTGSFNWTGDNGGTSVNDTWWSPSGTVTGTWHFRLRYSSGNNFYSTGSFALNTWYAMTSSPHYDFYKSTWGTGGGSGQGVFLCDWSDDGGSTIYHTCTLTVTMSEQSL